MEIQLFPSKTGFSYIKLYDKEVPIDLKDLVVFNSKNLPISNYKVENPSLIYSTDDNPINGYNVKIYDKYIMFIDDNGKNMVLYKPYLVISSITSKINCDDFLFLIGKQENIFWNPKYIAIMDENKNIISLSLSADITNKTGNTFNFKKIIFNTRNIDNTSTIYKSTRSYAPIASSVTSLAYDEYQTNLEDIVKTKNYTYTLDGNFYIDLFTQIMLWSTSLNSNMLGFIFVGKDEMYHGYNIKINPENFYPQGNCILYNKDMEVYDEFQFNSPVYDEIRLILNVIPEITIVSENRFEDQGKLQTVSLNYTIYNNLNSSFKVFLIHKLRSIVKKITCNNDQIRPNENKFRHELYWELNLSPKSENKFSTNFIIEY